MNSTNSTLPVGVDHRMEAEKYIGLALALTSSLLIGTSFIITKKGLMDSARNNGGRVGEGFDYLKNPMWWAGTSTSMYNPTRVFDELAMYLIWLAFTLSSSMLLGFVRDVSSIEFPYCYSVLRFPFDTALFYRLILTSISILVILGEVANFLAYSFAPAILVTPLGAGSVFVSAILSSIFLNENLGRDGVIGCVLCVIGSLVVILHAPEEDAIETVDDVFRHFVRPGFMIYIVFVAAVSVYLIYYVGPRFGKRNMLVYISICSLALDLFSTNRVTPIYYVFFTTATIIASIILSEGVKRSTPVEMLSVLSGFTTIFIGVFMVNGAKSNQASFLDKSLSRRTSISLGPRLSSGSLSNKAIVSEHHLLKTFDEDHLGFSEDDDIV
ncbi:hypothetical protein BDEG_25633 [Batrachochytrium dendrobatidis JEL423]|uniref:Magnesium transporter n=1 Tax=Batrachochytrium dendrobatidis (strain JEL423) TaxID=403673 RepID=A0A177WPW3_BATDL|nr:hypothetical protein BDEG_25633 [Batrachochytrium dendrobatidis JEL423]